MNSIKGAGTSLRINCGQGSSDRSRGALLRVLDRSRCFGWSITYGAEAPISFKEMGTTTRTRMISLDDFYIAGVAAPSMKWPRSFERREGVVWSRKSVEWHHMCFAADCG